MAQENLNPLLFEGEHLFRVVELNSEPWFVLADVCAVLGISNVTQARGRLDEDEWAMFNIGRQGEATIINESGLWSSILSSRKPEAKRLKRWVTSEVLPAIRKHGFYDARKSEPPANNPPEPRVFPAWPMEELRTKKGVIDMYRMLWGIPAAQWLSPQLGFPIPPVDLVEHGRQLTLTLVPTMRAA